MSSKQIAPVTAGFEALKLTNEHNAEYWSARDLQPLLGYSQWRRFEQAIERAMASCEASGNKAQHHIAGAGKPITGGKGAVQLVSSNVKKIKVASATHVIFAQELRGGGL